MVKDFPIRYFFECCCKRFLVFVRFRSFFVLCPCNSFCYVLSVPIFYSKMALHPLHLFVGLSSCILFLLVVRIFCYHFGISCFVCCCLTLSGYLLSPPSFRQYLLIYLFMLYCQICQPNISLCVFPSVALSLVVTVSLPLLLA